MSTGPTQTKSEKSGVYKSLYGLVKFLIWLTLGLAVYYAAVQLQTWYDETPSLKGTLIGKLLTSLPTLAIIGSISMIRFVDNIETIAGLVKFAVGWLLLCVIAAVLFNLALLSLSATVSSSPT